MAIWAVSLLNMELSPHILTATVIGFGIRSLTGVGTLAGPIPNQSSTPEV